MITKKPEKCEEEWEAAQAALEAAQKLPGGPERFDALRKAGQMRYDADRRRRAIRDGMECKKTPARPDSN
jgi:hypothetical protein